MILVDVRSSQISILIISNEGGVLYEHTDSLESFVDSVN
jgi:hypothetical protein